MFRKVRLACLLTTLSLFNFPLTTKAQGTSGLHARPLVIQQIDENRRVFLRGNTRPEANFSNDRGPVADTLRLEHMLLQLNRPAEQEEALQQFLSELQTQGSPNFHNWITAQEFGERFGEAQSDLDAISGWLRSHGFEVNVIYPSGVLIDFSGTAGQVRKAFQADVHFLEVNGEKHIANMNDPRIPAALAPVINGVVSLHDFRPHAMYRMHKPRPQFTFSDILGDANYAVVPSDLATIYNLKPLFSAGTSGQGQTIVLIENTDVFSASDWTTFRSTFGLAQYPAASFAQVHPAPSSGANNCSAPGVVAPDD